MLEQLTFSAIDDAARADECRRRDALDRHRQHVQTWFDQLAANDKERLAEWFSAFEFDTCVALSAAAGDYRCSHVINGK